MTRTFSALSNVTRQSGQDDTHHYSLRTTMRSFIVLLLIPFFLVLARAKPFSKKLSAEGSHPHLLVVLSSRS